MRPEPQEKKHLPVMRRRGAGAAVNIDHIAHRHQGEKAQPQRLHKAGHRQRGRARQPRSQGVPDPHRKRQVFHGKQCRYAEHRAETNRELFERGHLLFHRLAGRGGQIWLGCGKQGVQPGQLLPHRPGHGRHRQNVQDVLPCADQVKHHAGCQQHKRPPALGQHRPGPPGHRQEDKQVDEGIV